MTSCQRTMIFDLMAEFFPINEDQKLAILHEFCEPFFRSFSGVPREAIGQNSSGKVLATT